MEVFNTRTLTQKQRFNTALITGLIAAVVLGIVSGYVRKLFNFSMIVWAIGSGIAWVIRKTGRGVQNKFSILGAVYAVLGIVISDVVWLFGIAALFSPGAYYVAISLFIAQDISSIIWLMFRLVAVYIAYNYSRVF